jgi:hypothetical protein
VHVCMRVAGTAEGMVSREQGLPCKCSTINQLGFVFVFLHMHCPTV